MAHDTEVIVVGAGLAGLACAVRLSEAGRDVIIVDASDGPGGRVRTDVVDGFQLDRGFQVLLPAYPALASTVDLDALDLQPFAPGVVVQRGRQRWVLSDPWQQPMAAWSSVRAVTGAVMTPVDAARMLTWRQELVTSPEKRLIDREQVALRDRLSQRGFSARAVERFFQPFFSGVLFDPQLETSSRVAELILRSFFLGGASLPAAGMGSLPLQLAAKLPDGALLVDHPVSRLVAAGGAVRALLTTGEIVADQMVVAADGPSAATLVSNATGVTMPPEPIQQKGRGATTIWYAVPTSPLRQGALVISADRHGPVSTLAVVSKVAPSYAPVGQHLVAAVVVGVPALDDDALDNQVRAQLAAWVGATVGDWKRMRVDRIPWAQPRQTIADLPNLARSNRLSDRVWICGDHRDTGSIQGSLASGRRVADDLLASMRNR